MIGNKYPNIASGATLIGSAVRAPDRKYFRAAIARWKIFESITRW